MDDHGPVAPRLAPSPLGDEPPASGVVRELRAAPLDDASLARRAAEGHPAAARAVWDRYSRMVRGLLRRTLGPDQDVEDLLQESFLRFFQSVGGLRDPSLLASFLVGITLRVARSELRRRRVRRILRLTDPAELPEPVGPPSDEAARRAVRDLYAVLDGVQPDTRIVFVLRFVERLELTEIAVALDCSLATAKRRIARAEEIVQRRIARTPDLAAWLAERGGEP